MRFIGRFLWLVITVVTVIISMAFAASNDSEVTLHLWPFETRLSLPVWLAVLGALGAGIVTGGLIVWLSTIAIRTRNWHMQKKLKKMEKRMNDAKVRLADAETQSSNDSVLISAKK
jgi:uncharacterized membrane protein YciS (DUF1049 family)